MGGKSEKKRENADFVGRKDFLIENYPSVDKKKVENLIDFFWTLRF